MKETISIHAPREGSDNAETTISWSVSHFNPRPPRGERLQRECDDNREEIFQSTPPARGATPHTFDELIAEVNFNPRPPRGERHYAFIHSRMKHFISIHAPREGSDISSASTVPVAGVFQSTPPARGATRAIFLIALIKRISIHAPREGSDNGGIYAKSHY